MADKSAEDILDEENKKLRTVKYHQHGILSRAFNTKVETWIFKTPGDHFEFEGGELIDVLDTLSQDGYELICGSDGEFILRTKNVVEEVEEYWDTEPNRCKK